MWDTSVYPPTPKILYKTIKVRYPCPTWNNPSKMCEREVEVPDGVDLVTNSKIRETELIEGGNGDTVF
jgi:hypothetical protein